MESRSLSRTFHTLWKHLETAGLALDCFSAAGLCIVHPLSTGHWQSQLPPVDTPHGQRLHWQFGLASLQCIHPGLSSWDHPDPGLNLSRSCRIAVLAKAVVSMRVRMLQPEACMFMSQTSNTLTESCCSLAPMQFTIQECMLSVRYRYNLAPSVDTSMQLRLVRAMSRLCNCCGRVLAPAFQS